MRTRRFLGKLCIGLLQWPGGVEVVWRGGYEKGFFKDYAKQRMGNEPENE